jgi:hypothetical protein
MFFADGINYVVTCRLDKDCKRKWVEFENQCHSMVESPDMVDFVHDEVPTINFILTL